MPVLTIEQLTKQLNPQTGVAYTPDEAFKVLLNNTFKSEMAFGTSPTLQEVTTVAGKTDMFGGTELDSYLDRGITPTPGVDIQELRAQDQSWGDQVANGLIKASSTAVTSGLENLLSIPSALYEYATTDKGLQQAAYDNPIGRAFDNWNESLREALPNYYSQKETSLMQDLATTNFWFDKFANGVGYMAGAFASGYGVSKLFQLSKLAAVGQAGQVALASEMATLNNLSQVSKGIKLASATEQLAVSSIMSHGESAVEARGIYNSVKENLLAQGVDEETAEAEAVAAGNVGYGLNMAIVGLTNYAQFGKAIATNFKNSTKAINEVTQEMSEGVIKATAKQPGKLFSKDFLTSKGFDRIKRGAEGIIEEGGQEGGQFVTEKGLTEYYERKYDGIAGNDFASIANALGYGMEEAFGSKEGLESMLLGALLGGPSQIALNKGQFDDKVKRTEQVATLLNSSPLKKRVDAMKTIISLDKDIMAAAETGDEFVFKNLEYDQFKTWVKDIAENGGYEVLTEKLDMAKDLSEDEFKKMFGFDQSQPLPDTKENIIAKVKDRAAKINEKVESIKLKHGNQPQAVQDAIFDAVTNFDNIDQREAELSNKIAAISNGAVNYNSVRGAKRDNAEYKENFNKAVQDWEKTSTPDKVNEVKSLIKDLNKLANRREKYINQYNQALKDPASFSLKDRIAKEAEEREKIYQQAENEFIANLYNSNTDEDAEFGFDSTEFELETDEKKGEGIEITFLDKDDNEQTVKSTTPLEENVNKKTGDTWVNFTDEEGKKRGILKSKILAENPTEFSSKTNVKVKYKKGDPNNLYDEKGNAYDVRDYIEQIENNAITKTIKAQRQEIIAEAQRQSLTELLNHNESILNIINESLVESQKKVDSAVELLTKAKNNKLGKTTKIIEGKKVTYTILQLEEQVNKLSEELNNLITQRESLIEQNDLIEKEIESIDELGTAEDLRTYKSAIESAILRTEAIISKTEDKISSLQKVINRLKSLVKGFYTSYKKLLEKKYGDITIFNYTDIDLDSELSTLEENEQKIADKIFLNEETLSQLEETLKKNKEYLAFLNEQLQYINEVNELFQPILNKLIKDKNDNVNNTVNKKETEEIKPDKEKEKDFDNQSQKPSIVNPGFNKTVGQHFDAQDNETTIPSKRRWFRALPNLPLGDGSFSIRFVTPNTNKDLYDADEILLHGDSPETANIKVIIYRNGKPINSEGEAIDEANITSEGLYINIGLSEIMTPFGSKFYDVENISEEEVIAIQNSYNEFREEVFNNLKEGKKIFAPLTGKGNGVINKGNEPISVQEALGIDTSVNDLEIIIPDKKGVKNTIYPINSNQNISLTTGMIYMVTPGKNVIPLNNRQLNEEEVDIVFNLFSLLGKGLTRVYKTEEAKEQDKSKEKESKSGSRFIFSNGKRGRVQKYGKYKGKKGYWTNDKLKSKDSKSKSTETKWYEKILEGEEALGKQDSFNIKEYLESLIFMGKNNSNDSTRIYIRGKVLFFGNDKIDLKDIKKKEKEIKEFLLNKYIQISKEKLEHANNNLTSKYEEIVEVTKDGIAVVKEYDNYKHYLLSSENRQIEEIPLNTNIVSKDSGQSQFMSQYAIFHPQISETAIINNESESNEFKETDESELESNDINLENTKKESIIGTPVITPTEEVITEETVKETVKKLKEETEVVPEAETDADSFGISEEETATEEIIPPNKNVNPDELFKLATFKVDKENRININEAKQWIKEKIGLPVQVVNRLIDGKGLGQFANNIIKLSELGYKGVEYHEALHAVMRSFLSPKEFNNILKEAMDIYPQPSKNDITELKKLYPKSSVNELITVYYEEKIADSFEEYVLSNGKITPEGFKTKSFFEKLLDVIKKFLNLKTDSIQDLFEKIDSGYYKGKSVKINNTSSIYSAIPNMSEEETKFLLDGLTVMFMTNLFRDSNSIEDITELSGSKITEYYNKAIETLKEQLDSVEDNPTKLKIKNYITNSSNLVELINKHKEFLSQFKIELSGAFEVNEEGNITEEINKSKESSYDDNSINISVKDTTSSFIKLLIGTVPNYQYRNGITGFYELEDGGEVFNFLLNSLAGVTDYNEMIRILNEKSKIFPSIISIVRRLEHKTNNPQNHFRLQKQFQQTFSKYKFNYDLWLVNDNGTIYPIDPNSNKLENKIKDNWKSTIKNMALSGSQFFKRDPATGSIKPNIEVIKKGLKKLEDNKKNNNFDKARKFLEGVGFPSFNFNAIPNNEFLEFLQKDFEWIKDAFLNPDYTIDDIFGLKESTRFGKLISMAAKYQPNTTELMHIGPDGKTRYGVSMNNYFTTVSNILNEGLSLTELENKYPEMFGFFNEHSLLLKAGGILFDSKGKRNNREFKISISEGIQPQESSDGETFDELTFPDRIMLSFNSILDNKFPMIRTADKTLEFQMEVDLNLTNDISKIGGTTYEILRNYLLSESLRVKAVNNNQYNNIVYFNKRGKNFIMFKFLSERTKQGIKNSKDAKTYIEQNKEIIDKEIISHFNKLAARYTKTLVDNNMITPDGTGYINKGISENFVKEVEDRDEFRTGRISFNGLSTLAYSFAIKSYIANIEQHMIFYGDPAFYKNASDFFKRTSGASGTKKFAFTDEHTNSFINNFVKRFDKKVSNREEIKSLVYDDVTVMSKYHEEIKKAIGEKAAKAYETMAEADAQGLISLDEYREAMDRMGEWSKKHESLYQRLIKNDKLDTEEIDFIMQPLKLQVYGKQNYNNNLERNERLSAPVFYKYSVVPLIPQIIKDKSLQKLSEAMTEQQVGMVTFISGAKVGALVQESGALIPFYDKKGNIIVPNERLTYNQIPYRYLGIQLDINPKVKTKTTFGTQFRKIIKSNLFSRGKAKSQKLLELSNEYDSLISKITDKKLDNLLKEVGAVKVKEGWKVTNFNSFKELLRKSAIEREAPANLVDSINSITDSDNLIRNKIDSLPNRNKIENILLAIINNSVIKQKVNGGSKIQMASTGWESQSRKFTKEGLILSNELKYYTKENGKISFMEAKMTLPVKLQPYALHLGDGNLDKGLKILNEKIKELNDNRNNPEFSNGLDRRIINIIGYRIPTQGLNSIENIEIQEFLHPSAGELIVLPTEIVAKSGGDFDIDKLNILEPYFRSNIESDPQLFRKFLLEQTTEEIVLNNIDSLSDSQLKDLMDDLNNFSLKSNAGRKGKLKDYLESINVSSVESEFYEEIKNQLVSFNAIKKLLDKDIELNFIENEENEKAWFNRIIAISSEILSMPENYNELVTPNSTDNLVGLAKEIYNYEKGNETAEENPESLEDDSVFQWDIIQNVAQSFLSGKKGVGIAALQRTHHILSQSVNLSIEPFYKEKTTQIHLEGMEDNYSLADEYDIKGKNKISDIISEFINGYVDVAKNPFVFIINAGLQSANTWLYLIRRGVPVKTAGYFMNQPIIKDYLREQQLNESITNSVQKEGELSKNQLLAKIYSKYFGELAAHSNKADTFTKEALDAINKSPGIFFKAETLKKYIIEGSKENKTAPIDFYKNQLIILRDFINYQEQASAMSDLINITKQDTTAPKNLAAAHLNELMFNKVMAETPFVNAYKLISNTFLKSFKNVNDVQREIYNEFFITENPNFKKMMDLLIKDKLGFSSREKLEEIMDNFKNNFIKYLISSANYGDKSVAAHFKELFVGNDPKANPTTLIEILNTKSLPEAIKEIQLSKYRIKNNPIFKELVVIIGNGDFTEKSIFNNLKLFSRKMTKYESDVLTAGLRELSEKPNGSASKLIMRKLFLFSVIQSGIGNSPFSFYDKLPFDEIAPMVSKALSSYEANPNRDLSEFFIENYLNNLGNSTLVPKIPAKIIQKLADDSYNHINDDHIPEIQTSLPSVIRVPLEGPNSFLSRNMVLKTWIRPADAELRKKQGKKMGLFLPYVLFKTEDGFNYYEATSPISNPPYFTQFGKLESLIRLSNLPLPNSLKALNAFISSKLDREPTGQTSKGNNYWGNNPEINTKDTNDSKIYRELGNKTQSENVVIDEVNGRKPAIESNIQNKNVKFEEEQTTGYRNRTIKNASADATIAIAVDFNSAGEKLTKSSVLNQGKKYISLDANNLTVTQERVDKIVNELNSVNAKTLNIAGNGIYTMKGKYTQQQVDDFTYELLNRVISSPNLKTKIESIRSGGQTGFDEAGTKAGIKLGLTTLTLAPKGWTFRNINGQDISNEQQFKARFENITLSSKPIVAYRTRGNNFLEALEKDNAIGNPFGPYGQFKTTAGRVAVEEFIAWMIGEKHTDKLQDYRQAIINKIPKLKGKQILYYKDLGEPSHATALDFLINKYDWGNNVKSKNDNKLKIYNDTLKSSEFRKYLSELPKEMIREFEINPNKILDDYLNNKCK